MKISKQYLIMSMIVNFILLLLFCCLARAESIPVLTVAYEGSSETFDGQKAIASTIKARMMERKQTAEQICLAKYQFSCWKDGKPTQKRKLTQKELETARKAWNEAQAWEYNHYARHDCKPSWIKASKKHVRIGSHIFYKL